MSSIFSDCFDDDDGFFISNWSLFFCCCICDACNDMWSVLGRSLYLFLLLSISEVGVDSLLFVVVVEEESDDGDILLGLRTLLVGASMAVVVLLLIPKVDFVLGLL